MRARLAPDPRDLRRGRRDPLGRLPRRDALDVHGVQLLEGAALALDDEEIDQQAADDVAPGEDVAVAEIDGARDEGGEEGEQEVPQPVAGGAQRHALGAVARGVQLAGDGPDHGAPGGGEAEDEEAGEADHRDARVRRVLRRRAVQAEVPHRREDEEADEHPRAARHQRLASPVVLDDVEAVEGRAEVDAVEDHLRDEAGRGEGGLVCLFVEWGFIGGGEREATDLLLMPVALKITVP